MKSIINETQHHQFFYVAQSCQVLAGVTATIRTNPPHTNTIKKLHTGFKNNNIPPNFKCMDWRQITRGDGL